MKLRFVSLLFVALVFGLAAVASADLVGYNVILVYNTSYAANGSEDPLLPVTTAGINGTTKTTLNLDGTAVVHSFEVYVTMHDMPADQDACYIQFNPVASGGAALNDGGHSIGDFYSASALSLTPVNPPAMGPPGNQSNQSAASAFVNNSYTAAMIWIVSTGGTGTSGNGTFGDMMACVGTGVPAPTIANMRGLGEAGAYDMGTMLLSSDAVTSATPGLVGFTFDANPGYFGTFNNNGGSANLNGMATINNLQWPEYHSYGDSVEMIAAPVPEPSTLALLGCGLFGLLAYAWRKRK